MILPYKEWWNIFVINVSLIKFKYISKQLIRSASFVLCDSTEYLKCEVEEKASFIIKGYKFNLLQSWAYVIDLFHTKLPLLMLRWQHGNHEAVNERAFAVKTYKNDNGIVITQQLFSAQHQP